MKNPIVSIIVPIFGDRNQFYQAQKWDVMSFKGRHIRTFEVINR